MKYILCVLCLLAVLMFPVGASEIVAPEVPDDAQMLMPPEDIGLADRLSYLLQAGLQGAQPQVAPCIRLCGRILCAMLLLSMVHQVKGYSGKTVEIAGIFAICALLLGSTGSMIQLGTQTVQQISQYGKLLLPVLTAALASQGGSVSAAALCSATALFDAVVCSLICSLLLPMVSVYLVLSAVGAATEDDFLHRLRDLLKQIMSWSLKLMLYTFTGYISISGIISGAVDQTAVKAAKLTISGMVPVVGGILSDASETVLVGAGIVKNSVGIYGLLGILVVTIVPFLTVGIHYLLLKLTTVLGSAFASKALTTLMSDFSTAMGLVLAMTGSVCMIQLISIIYFLRGMS